jgi:tetratricopeptide (TPR) repeat protein
MRYAARCGTTRQRAHAGSPRALRRDHRAVEALSSLYGSEAEKSLDVPRQVDLLSAPGPGLRARAEPIRPRRQGDRHLPPDPRRGVRQQAGRAGARSPVHRHRAPGPSWPRSCAARSSSRSPTTRSRRCSSASGRPSSTQLGDNKGAVEVYREILTANPAHESRPRGPRAHVLRGTPPAEIAAMLEPLYESASEFEQAARIYEVQLGKLTGPDRRRCTSAWRAGRGQALRQPSAPPRGGARRSSRIRAGITRSKRPSASPGDRCVGRAGRGVHPRPRAPRSTRTSGVTLLRLARVYEFELGDAAHAVATHLRVLEIEPRDADALAAFDRLYLGAGMYDDLAEILRRRIEITHRSRRAARAVLPPRRDLQRRARRSGRGAGLLPGACSSRRAATGAPSSAARRSTSGARSGAPLRRPTRS